MALITIDGLDLEEYCIVDGLEETFTLLEGAQSVRKQNNAMFYDIIGTEFHHTVLIRKNPDISIEKWNKLWGILSAPVDFHTIVIHAGPYIIDDIYNRNDVMNRDEITYWAHISTGKRNLEYIDSFGNKHWGDYSIELIPQFPLILAQGRMRLGSD